MTLILDVETFPVVQWLRICLLKQAMLIGSLVHELRFHMTMAVKPMCPNHRVQTL